MPGKIIAMTDAYTQALIEPHELSERIKAQGQNLRILDSTFVMPGATPSARDVFAGKRIGPAAFFDIDAVADRASPLPHMLPSPGDFARAVSDLGISNADEVIVYGQGGIIMGPARAWWMFRTFGHDRVRVLNGGLPLWEAYGLPVESGPPAPPVPGYFKADFRPALVKSLGEVRQASESGASCILDARAPDRFAGRVAEPRPGLRSGHIPSSLNLPVGLLVADDTGRLLPPEKLHGLLEARGIGLDGDVITSCGSGVTACVIALALYTLGRGDAAVYDGSWVEWGQGNAQTPVAKIT